MKQMIYSIIVLTSCLLMGGCKKQETKGTCACGPSCQCDAKTKHETCICPSCVCTGD